MAEIPLGLSVRPAEWRYRFFCAREDEQSWFDVERELRRWLYTNCEAAWRLHSYKAVIRVQAALSLIAR
jgi:hypothetical protein